MGNQGSEPDGTATPGADYLDDNRSILTFGAIFGAALALALLAFAVKDLLADYDGLVGVLAACALVLVWAASFAGALMFGRHRAAVVRRSNDFAARRQPPWFGTMLAVIPGVVLVLAQMVRAASPVAGDVLGLLAAYVCLLISGLATGLVLRR